jgi:hypothetical protein
MASSTPTCWQPDQIKAKKAALMIEFAVEKTGVATKKHKQHKKKQRVI